MAGTEPLETAVVAVRGDPFASGLDREGGEIRVGNEIAAGAGLRAEVGEDRPVARARCEDGSVRLGAKHLAEVERLRERCRPREHLRVRDDSYETAEHELGDP